MREKRITNTSQQPPELHLAEALIFGPNEAILAQERRGAEEMAGQASRLPSDGLADPAFSAMGIVLGDVDTNDPMFRAVTLPDGWRIERTDHDMWTRLVDAEGRERASMFYKAAFYDRRAFIRPTRIDEAQDAASSKG